MHRALKVVWVGSGGVKGKYGTFKLGMGAFKIRPSCSMHPESAPKAFMVEWTVNCINKRKEHDDSRDVA